MSRRILVLSASVGAGHVRAAQAMELALKQVAPKATVVNVDVLTLTGAVFRRLYGKAYIDLVNVAPHLLGYIYDITDHTKPRGHGHDRLRRIGQRINLGKVVDLLDADGCGWDMVVNTHFLPADIIATRRRRKRWSQRQVTVVTDFDAHAFWVNQPTERYFVATEEAALSLGRWGVARGDVEITGIPVHPVFAQAKGRDECRRKHGLATDRPVVLVLAGGFGVGPIERVYDAVLGIERPVSVAVVAGRNAALKEKLGRKSVPSRHQAQVIGFTTEIDELMGAADIVVTKPGGLTTSEVLSRGAVMAIINPIPGQESRNSDWLLENGAAVKINSLSAAAYKIETLLADAGRLARLHAAATALGRPQAAFDVAVRVMGMI